MDAQMKHHPAGNRVALNNQAADLKLDASLSASTELRPGYPAADVAGLSAEAWDECMRWYSSGYRNGLERGRVLADEDAARLWREAGKVVRGLAGRDALPGTDWMQFATGEQLTEAAEQRRAEGVAKFRADHDADRAEYLAGGTR